MSPTVLGLQTPSEYLVTDKSLQPGFNKQGPYCAPVTMDEILETLIFPRSLYDSPKLKWILCMPRYQLQKT